MTRGRAGGSGLSNPHPRPRPHPSPHPNPHPNPNPNPNPYPNPNPNPNPNQVVEMARRTVWAVFRVEWEMVHKIYHHDPSSVPLAAAEHDEEGEEMGLLRAES